MAVGTDSPRGAGAPQRDVGQLRQAINLINQRIRQIEEHQCGADAAIERLVNPRPRAIEEATDREINNISKEPVTIEDELIDVGRKLDAVLRCAADQCNTLHGAV